MVLGAVNLFFYKNKKIKVIIFYIYVGKYIYHITVCSIYTEYIYYIILL